MNKIAAFLRGFANGLEKEAEKVRMAPSVKGGVTSNVNVTGRDAADVRRGQRLTRAPMSGVPYATTQRPVAATAAARSNLFKPSLPNPFAHLMNT